MTVSVTTDRRTFSCDGSTRVFSCNFRVFDATEIVAYLITVSSNTSVQLAYGVDYTVSSVGDPTTVVTTTTAYSAAYQLQFRRVTQRLQLTDYLDNDQFPAETHERALDRLTHIAQEIDSSVSRAVLVPEPESGATLAASSVRAGKMLGFDPSTGAPESTAFTQAQVAALIAASSVSGISAGHIAGIEVQTLAAGETTITLTENTYTPGTHSCFVAANGGLLAPGVDFTEASESSIELAEAYDDDVTIMVIVGRMVSSGFDGSAVTFSQLGGSSRSTQDKLREVCVSPEDFGADPTGATSAVDALNAATAYLAALGGGSVVGTGRYLIDASITIPDGVNLLGPWVQPDEKLPASAADYDGMRGALVISSAATVSVGDSSGVEGWIAIRSGLDLPFADAAAATAGVAAFAGTAFTVAGAGATFRKLLILGFSKAIYSSGFERVRVEHVSGDCTNGVEIIQCFDISRLHGCHFWPWTTVHQSWVTNALLRRTGHAYLLSNVGDWNMASQCFSYGYYRGLRVADCDNVTAVNCGADNTSTASVGDHSGSIGMTVEGSSKSTRFVACQAAAQETGFYMNGDAGTWSELINSQSWGCSARGVLIDGGDVSVLGGEARDEPLGVVVNDNASRVFIDRMRFRNNSTGPIGFNTSNATTYIGDMNDFSDTADGSVPVANVGNWPIPTIASASTVNLPANGKDFQISGTTNVGTLAGGWKGRTVTLYFSGILTVTNGTGTTNSMRLTGATNFTTAAGSTLTLRHNGTQWYETGRCA